MTFLSLSKMLTEANCLSCLLQITSMSLMDYFVTSIVNASDAFDGRTNIQKCKQNLEKKLIKCLINTLFIT